MGASADLVTLVLAAAWLLWLAAATVRAVRGAGSSWPDLLLYFFVLSVVSGAVVGFFPGADYFIAHNTLTTPEFARMPLAVCGAAVVLALFALLDLILVLVRGDPLPIAVSSAPARTLAGLVPVAVGGLVGLTVFR